MDVEDVLPMSDLLSNDLLCLLDDHESSSRTEYPAVPIPAPPPNIVSARATSCQPLNVSTLDDGELTKFLTRQRNRNTERKTKSDVSVWHNWCKSVGETRLIGDIPPGELDKLLVHFFTKVKKRDGGIHSHARREVLSVTYESIWASIIAFYKTDSFRYLVKPL